MAKRKADIIKTTLRVPKTLWDRVKIEAIKRNTTAESFIIQALTAELKKGGN